MRKIPEETMKEMILDPFYNECCLKNKGFGKCGGRVTIEHSTILGGQQCNNISCLIPLCARMHGVDEYQDRGTEVLKEIREWVAVNRMSEEHLQEHSKASDWKQKKIFLNNKYGTYK